jgi:L-asparaginase
VSGFHVSKRPRVAVIGTGGTFAMHARHSFDWIEYSESGVVHPIGDLMERMERLAPDIDTVPVSFRTLGSTSITPTDWLELARLIESTAARADIDAFVITHGTATLEETAWFLDLAVSPDIPVVVTGAQRPFNTEGSDAAANLRAALAVSVSEGARGLGTLVVMDSLVFSARDVTKAASFELGAFEAPGAGPLARVEADARVDWRARPCGKNTGQADKPRGARFPIGDVAALPRVDIVLSYAGADGAAIGAFAAAGAKAIVSAGLAPGRPAAGEIAAFAAARASGVVIAQATRAARGCVPVQEFLTRDGILAGGTLSPQKLRILLMLAMTTTPGPEQLQRIILDT